MTRLLAAVLLLGAASACAQPRGGASSRTLDADPWCDRDLSSTGDAGARACEVRETVTRADALDLDATPNGAVTVKRWDRTDVLVRARVVATGRDDAQAERAMRETAVEVDGGTVRTRPPEGGWIGESRWSSVSFEVFAPRETDLTVRTLNGSIEIAGIEGAVRAWAMNGSVALADVGGDVRVQTVNGSVSVQVSGGAWDGDGLFVETTNGSVALELPSGFSGDLRASTRVGRIATSGVGDDRPRRQRGTGDQIETRLGRGGAPVRLATVNGSISIRQDR